MDAGDEATSQKGYAEWCRQALMISDRYFFVSSS